jgi:hypothetical protein
MDTCHLECQIHESEQQIDALTQISSGQSTHAS